MQYVKNTNVVKNYFNMKKHFTIERKVIEKKIETGWNCNWFEYMSRKTGNRTCPCVMQGWCGKMCRDNKNISRGL